MTLLAANVMQRATSGSSQPLLPSNEPHPLSPVNDDESPYTAPPQRTHLHQANKASIAPIEPTNLVSLPTHTKPQPLPPTSAADDNDGDEDDGDDQDDMNDMSKAATALSTATIVDSSKRTSTLEQLSSLDYYSTTAHEAAAYLYQFATFQVILEPNSRFKNVWDYLIIGIILYNAFIIPYYIAFDITLSVTLLPLDILCTISMAIDILVTLRTAFIDFSGNTCYDSRAIARRYWNRGLILDLCGTFPMDIFSSLVIGYGQRYSNLLKSLGLLRASRLAYNDRLAAFNSPTARILKLLFGFFWSAFSHTRTSTRPACRMLSTDPPSLLLVCLPIGWVSVFDCRMAHLFGAIFWFTACVENHAGTWINVGGFADASLTTQYIVSLYWALTTMVTVGYGDIVPTTVYEQAVVIPILMLSALIYATIFGNMAYAIETITSTIRRYQSRMDMVKEFISVYELPVELQKKLFDYTNAMWNQNKGFETEQMIAHLPTSVKAEVMLHINESLIQRVPLLKQCSDRFLEAIILRMSSQVCLPGDYVFKEGDKSREMYFVRTGSVEIIMEDESGVEEVIAEIHSFSDCPFFGEISLLLGETRTASAKATTKCILSSLSQQDFFDVLSMFPDEENSLRETASQRLQNDIDREQAALKKRKVGGSGKKGAEDDDEDEDDNEMSGKTHRGLATHASHASREKKSKHETRLNTLEMTTLGGAAHPNRERGMSTTDMGRSGGGGGLVAPERRMSGSRSGSNGTVAKGAGRMNRLNAGGALTRHGSRTEASDSDTDQPAAATTADKQMHSQHSSASVASTGGGDEMEAEAEGEQDELETRMSHQRELRQQLTSKDKTPRQHQLHSSPSIGAPQNGSTAELELMRLSRDVVQLREKERGVEKAQLELDGEVRSMQQHIGELNNKVDRLIAILLAQGGKAATAIDQSGLTITVDGGNLKTARTKTMTPAASHRREESLSHKRENSISQPATAMISPLVQDRRRSVTNGANRGPPGGAVVAKPNPIAGTVLAGGASGGSVAVTAATPNGGTSTDSEVSPTMSFSTSSAD